MDSWQSREVLDRREKNLEKENKKGIWVILMGNLVRLWVARLWLYREPHIKTLVANKRKQGAKESRKASSGSGDSKTRGHPDVLSVVKGIK